MSKVRMDLHYQNEVKICSLYQGEEHGEGGNILEKILSYLFSKSGHIMGKHHSSEKNE